MSDDYRLRADLQRIVSNAGAAPYWNTASDKPVVPDRYTRADVEAAVKRAIEAAATITRQHIYYDSAGTGFSEEKFDDAIRALASDPAALGRIIKGDRE
jgi:hypothetical protein